MGLVLFAWFVLLFILCTALIWWYICSVFLRGYNWSIAVFVCILANWAFWQWTFHGLHDHTRGSRTVRWIGSQMNKGNILRFLVGEIQSAFSGQKEGPPPKGVSSLALATGAALMSFVFGPAVGVLFTKPCVIPNEVHTVISTAAVQAQFKSS